MSTRSYRLGKRAETAAATRQRILEAGWAEIELAAVLAATYRGRRLESIRQLAERIAASAHVAPGWTVDGIADALTILTGIESFEALTTQPSATAELAAETLFSMTRAFLLHDHQAQDRAQRNTPNPRSTT